MPAKKLRAGNGWHRRPSPWRTVGARGRERHSPVSKFRMAKSQVSLRRPQTFREEVANSVSSGVGLLAVIAGIPLLIGSALQRRNEFSLAGAVIFAVAMV